MIPLRYARRAAQYLRHRAGDIGIYFYRLHQWGGWWLWIDIVLVAATLALLASAR